VRALLAALALLLLLTTAARTATAHTRSVSYSSWKLTAQGATAKLRVSRLDMTTARPEVSDLGATLADRLQLIAAGVPCERGTVHELAADPAWRAFEWRTFCATGGAELQLRADLIFDSITSHLHFARVQGDGRDVELVLSDHRRVILVPPGTASATTAATATGALARFIPIGVEHILSGADHLVFLLALALLALGYRRTRTSARSLALLATGFTLGHSVTLALAVLGYASPAGSAVEALIGLSIALVAIENVWLAGVGGRAALITPVAGISVLAAIALLAWALGAAPAGALTGCTLAAACYFGLVARSGRPERLRFGITAMFGLVHGFGFAGTLMEMELPRQQLGFALLGFNLGVELGQLWALAAVLLAFTLIRRSERLRVATLSWGSAAAAAAGTFWLLTRTFG